MEKKHLSFITTIGKNKPNNIKNKDQSCPFCAREDLVDIIDVQDSIILLKNKFPVLENTFQTVLIETDDCHGEISTYTKEHLVKLIKFGIKHWLSMIEGSQYRSVIFFKNHGPLSGGSISHPHMQIVGLHDIDYRENISPQDFQGLLIDETDDVQFTISTTPRIGFTEFNVKITNLDHIESFAKYIQACVDYILNAFLYRCNSYNLFFYQLGDDIYAKIVPRFITTPIYIGYSIPQVPDNLEWVRDEIQLRYFSK